MSHRKAFLLLFMLGFFVRLIPEVLSYPYPIGADTFMYAGRMLSGVVWHHWSRAFSTWLLYAMLIPAYEIVRVDPFLLLKLVAPTLYALNVCGVYYFAGKALNWETKKALTAAFLFAVHLASLRVSWDCYRNMLGLAILLFVLPSIRKIEKRKNFASFVLGSMLVVFSHELASVIMFAVIFGVMISDFFRGERARMLKVLAAASPALAIFSLSVYLMMFPVAFHRETNVINWSGDILYPRPGGLFFLVDYLGLVLPDMYYPTYLDLVSDVLSQFGILYLLCLPFAFVGFFRDRILDGWTPLLLVGTFNSLITPFCALDYWNRWMYMLIYPFTFYTVNGIGKVLESDRRWLGRMKTSKRTMFGILLLMIILAPPLFRVAKYHAFGATRIMLLHTTVPSQDVEGTIEVIGWLNSRIHNGSCLLVHEYFIRWAALYLDKKCTIVYYFRDVQGALTLASDRHFDPIYMIWWDENVEWSYGTKSYFDITVPTHFAPVFGSGRVSVFEYDSSSHS